MFYLLIIISSKWTTWYWMWMLMMFISTYGSSTKELACRSDATAKVTCCPTCLYVKESKLLENREYFSLKVTHWRVSFQVNNVLSSDLVLYSEVLNWLGQEKHTILENQYTTIEKHKTTTQNFRQLMMFSVIAHFKEIPPVQLGWLHPL